MTPKCWPSNFKITHKVNIDDLMITCNNKNILIPAWGGKT